MKKLISRETLTKMLMSLKTATPVTILSVTVPAMKKTGNPYYGNVRKITSANVFINFHYANSVNNRRNKEGKDTDFVAKPRVWGTRIPGTPCVEHKGNLYLETRFLKTANVEYIDTKGNPVSKTVLEPFLQKSKKTSRQGVDEVVILRDYKLENIVGMNFLGDEFIITDL